MWMTLLLAASLEGVRFEENLMIPMRDGVRLATDVYRPARGGTPLDEKLPVLLQRTPYGKTGSSLVESARYFAANGYVVALQDVRGAYASEGVFTKYIGEGEDGFDTIEYLSKLPYANGKVGMWGTSYAAHVQANAAKVETEEPLVKEHLARAPIESWLEALPLRKGLNPLSIAPNFEDYILEMATHGDYDDDYWKHRDVNWQEHYDETLDIPMIHVSGWYDSYAGGTLQNFVELSKQKTSPIYLLMGPWIHGGNTRSYAGDVEFGLEAARADFPREFHLRWFDRFLKGGGAAAEEPVRIFVMGTGDGHKDENGRMYHGGRWITASSWPLPETTGALYYFHGDGSLSKSPPKERESATTYIFDPRDPVPTLGGAFSSTSPVFEPGAYHQEEREGIYGAAPPFLPLSARPDVVVFQTAPLAFAVEVVGPIEVELHASSTALDTDFTVKLVDVYPPSSDFPSGFEMNLTDGILRARYRNGPERQQLMTPGEIYRLTIEPFPTANVFKKGHRIRVDVSSSNFPRFDVNPNTGEPLGMNRRMQNADNTLYHEAGHPSHVVLPILERK